ncbi:phage tail tape measure protein [Clostridioides difficile]|uniref:phage tail tape measure protein n=1 Tax=Clostridioides difficile TaxID=1496 RepID=UPI001056745A|nr:phage tail tape measure protein [Clostridioides difficile]
MDIVTDGLTALGMTANDTTEFVDVMAATITNSNTSVELMGETFKYIGSVGGALGVSMKDLSLATGLMAK